MFTHLKFGLATATHKFKLVKITHICLICDQTFTIIMKQQTAIQRTLIVTMYTLKNQCQQANHTEDIREYA